MIEIEQNAWQTMVLHAERTYPNECCGAMLGHSSPDKKVVTEAVALENTWDGAQGDRYQVRPEDLLAQKHEAQRRFEVGHRMPILLYNRIGARQDRRSVGIGEERQDLVDRIAALRRIFAVALGRIFALIESWDS